MRTVCPLQVGEGRALYNLGNVYHTKGKQMAKNGSRDPGDFPPDVKDCLLRASEFYMCVDSPSASALRPCLRAALFASSLTVRLKSR